MNDFSFDTYWNSIPQDYKNVVGHIAELLNHIAFSDPVNEKDWGGKVFWAYIYISGKSYAEQQNFRNNIGIHTKDCSYATVRAVRKQGLRTHNAKVAFCYSAFIHDDSFFPKFLLGFQTYCKKHPSHLDVELKKFKAIFDDIAKNLSDTSLVRSEDDTSFEEAPTDTPQTEDTYSLKLELPNHNRDFGISYFASGKVTFVGRKPEQGQLLEYLKDEPVGKFSWFQLSGVAGQGKSRLALWFIHEARNNEEQKWNAGFLYDNEIELMSGKWEAWQPDIPHLIAVDYVIGQAKEIGHIMNVLARRKNELNHQVKLLLIERQPWDTPNNNIRGANEFYNLEMFDTRAPWYSELVDSLGRNAVDFFDTRHKSGRLTLEQLGEKYLIDIVKEVAAQEAKHELQLDDDSIAKKLSQIDDTGRPLYACFLGLMIADGGDVQTLTNQGLLNKVLVRERRDWWKAEFGDNELLPKYDDDTPAIRLAVLATITDGFCCDEATKKGVISKANTNTRRQALAMTGGELNPASDIEGAPQLISPIKPDLLGEWFVLRYLSKGLPSKQIIDMALKYSPEKTGRFIEHVSQDFSEHPLLREIIEHINYQGMDIKTLYGIFITLYENFEIPPASVILAIENCAQSNVNEEDYAPVMLCLGNCYYLGQGVAQNMPLSVDLFKKAADAGSVRATFNLGVCYSKGKGVKQSPWNAYLWYKKAAEAGYVAAMYNLGLCYVDGSGVKQSWEYALQWNIKAANLGHTGAMDNLGTCYAEGKGIKQNWDSAVQWFTKAANLGNTGAMTNLGACYAGGKGVKQNWESAVFCYQKAGDAGNTNAAYNLGNCYAAGCGVEQCRDSAFQWFKKAGDADNADAAYSLGICYAEGKGVKQNWGNAVQWYQKAADAGDVLAMSKLGDCYALGQGVVQSWGNAALWYQKSANAGNASAMTLWGACYAFGLGVPQNWDNAAQWYQKAAEADDVLAMSNLGDCFVNAQGVAQSWGNAFFWYQKAAFCGDFKAMRKLGDCFARGYGVDQSRGKAFLWYQNAANTGDASAMGDLGDCYAKGHGVDQSWDSAFLWYQKAADEGNPCAICNLGICYANGHGVEKNRQTAINLITKADKLGFSEAIKILSQLKEQKTEP